MGTKAALVLTGGPAYRQCVGSVDAQIDELVRVVDQLLAGLTGADQTGVGAVGVPGAPVGPGQGNFTRARRLDPRASVPGGARQLIGA